MKKNKVDPLSLCQISQLRPSFQRLQESALKEEEADMQCDYSRLFPEMPD